MSDPERLVIFALTLSLRLWQSLDLNPYPQSLPFHSEPGSREPYGYGWPYASGLDLRLRPNAYPARPPQFFAARFAIRVPACTLAMVSTEFRATIREMNSPIVAQVGVG